MQRLKKYLFEDEAVIGIKKLTDYPYWRILRYNLIFLNIWPGKELGENPSKYMGLLTIGHVLLNGFFLTSGTMYVIIHAGTLTFYELGHMYITMFMSAVSTLRILITLPFTKYRTVAATFITKIHLFYYKDVSDYAMKTHKRVHFISHLFTIFLTCQMFGGLSLFNILPMWYNFSSGKYKQKILQNSTYEHSLYFSTPFDKDTHLNSYIIVCIYNWSLSYVCSILFCMLDLLLCLMVFHIWGHFKILLHDLDSFSLPAKAVISSERKMTINVEMYSEEELKQVSEKLKRCIDYHQIILDFTNQISEAFGSMLLIYLVFHQVSGCLLLLECSQMTVDALLRYAPLTIILFQQLIQYSIVFELIGSTSEKLKDAVYGMPWQYMDTKNRRTVTIFLMNVQKPIHVKALGVVDVGVTTMAMILKTSFSYFAFLRSV